MIRDITMTFAVLVSIVSLGFGVYKNIEAGNAKSFAYDQAYKVMNVIQGAPINDTTKANMLDAALSVIATPPPVIDLSRSSAGIITPSTCDQSTLNQCNQLASDLASSNKACELAKGTGDACQTNTTLKKKIRTQCILCYPH